MAKLAEQEFDVLATFLKRRSGLVITFDKMYLLENRLLPVLDTHEVPNLLALVKRLKGGIITEELASAVVEAMTINESMFFRDQKPFRFIQDVVFPDYEVMGKHKVNIWSAACSNGQEPYSLAMMLDQNPRLSANIYATDVAVGVLERARQGRYTQFEVQRGLPIQLLMQYFDQRENSQWQIKETIRSMVDFQPLNLLDMFNRPTKFDIIMCRYVLIYFDEATKHDILMRMAEVLAPGGYLFLGASETLMNLHELPYEAVPEQPGIFRLKRD